MSTVVTNENDYVDAPIAYLVDTGERPQTLVYPPSSGRDLIRPEQQYYEMRVHDCRTLPEPPALVEA